VDRQHDRRRLGAALVVTAAFLVVEVAGGLLSGSLALLADATHMFADVGALILAYAAMSFADRPPSRRYTFGLYRAEILAAFVNAQILLLVSASIFYEAFHRLRQPEEIDTGVMLGVAVVGLAANLVSMRFLHGHHHESLNLKAAYVEVFTDMLGSLAVIAGALIIRPTGWLWVDPLLSAGIGIVILPRAWALLRQTGHILLEGTPPDVDVNRLRSQLLDIPGVNEIHDLHFWTLTSGLHSASVHVCASPETSRGQVLKEVQSVLQREADVDHATVQIELGAGGECGMARGHD
jgi:cobalt-zinc-cadmium efflux system protein